MGLWEERQVIFSKFKDPLRDRVPLGVLLPLKCFKIIWFLNTFFEISFIFGFEPGGTSERLDRVMGGLNSFT